jgi:flagellar biosynthesis chaperone FliJ
MKAFKFPFETVKNVKTGQLRNLESKLHNIMLEISYKNREFYAYVNTINARKVELKELLLGAIDFNKIRLYSILITNMEKRVAELLYELRKLEEEKEKIVSEYLKLNNEKKALEKLKAKLWSNYMYQYTKDENVQALENIYFTKEIK